ncbi:MAG: N-6 DNA methylase, partial [Candidatus Cloacimonetes bacterium]|nr:N-6 DNA methylase [Candidatus Cloacimonadota bacterium]
MIDLLRNLKNKEDIQNLFIEHLNYSHSSGSISSSLSDKLRKEIISIEKIAEQDTFIIIYCILPKLLKGSERPISIQISKTFTYNLIIFSNETEDEFHFTNLKYLEKKKEIIKTPHRPFRRIVIGPVEKLRTAAERIELLKIEDEHESSLLVNLKCDRAFDVEAVSREFYKDYVNFYREFRTYLMKKNQVSQTKADEYTETIFNRVFFLYFIQKKGYLENDPDFIFKNFVNIGSKNYYSDFIIPLFERISIKEKNPEPEKIPFLNGGLFEFNDDEKNIKIENNIFEVILKGLFEKYNFTVREDTELEKEVAIDPEMLGTIFERLILGLEQNKYKDIPDARRVTGSYYTPKFVVSFMVKQSLLNDLIFYKTLKLQKNKTKELVFNLKTEQLTETELRKIKERLIDIRIVDPAVGSGAYPVGILLKIVEIIEAIDKSIDPNSIEKQNYKYDLKRKIIENCIYGVDLQEKAVHLTNLRLWLSLIVDLEVDNIDQIPPLPNLDFHIYEGDSLVSKIAGYDFDHERKLKPDAVGLQLLNDFQKAKTDFQQIIILEDKNKAKEKISKLKTDYLKWFLNKKKEEEIKYMADIAEGQGNFFEEDEQNIDLKKDTKERIKIIEKKLAEVHLLAEHFNWGLDFFDEIETNGGFDIVIANPPYGIKVETITRDEFKLNSKDSYGIFVSLGLKILKPKGTLCYIMSDTWQTIKSHKNLRDQLLKETDAQFLISVPADTFGATVNTGVYTFVKKTTPREKLTENADNWLIAADLSPFKIKQAGGSWNTGNLEAGFELLTEQDNFDDTKDGITLYSERDFAVFAYRQKLIPRFSNHSFFIASPKLFKLMEDTGKSEMHDGKTIHKIDFNGKELELVKLGDIAKVVVGLQTGDNDYYIRQSKKRIKGASKNYKVVDWDLVLDAQEIEQISN